MSIRIEAPSRHFWKLIAASGVALVVYAWAESNRRYEDQSELFALGGGAVTAGALFWRDPPETRPRS